MRVFILTIITILAAACGSEPAKLDFGANIREASQVQTSELFGNDKALFLVEGRASAAESANQEDLLLDHDGLFIGLPESAFGSRYLFGGVITQAAHKSDTSVGMLKLSDLEPMHVEPKLSDDQQQVTFFGCAEKCQGDTFDTAVFSVGVIGKKVRGDQTFYLLNMADLTKNMKIVDKVSNFFSRGFLAVTGNEIIRTDYSEDTFVFDVKTKMGPILFNYRSPTHVVSRWYLQPSAPVIAEKFTPRSPKQESGFFLTQRLEKQLVTRFAKPSENKARKVKYFIKGAPKIAKKGVTKAFEDWNATFLALTGEELLDYEFVNADDPRYEKLMTGDIRYNVIEWDTTNKAPYGGLGPSIAFQPTGQILSGNVLIQGPSIIRAHRKWFGLETEDGKKEEDEKKPTVVAVNFNEVLSFRVPATMPEYQDPMMAPGDLANPPPANVSYEEYMTGYFHELIAHEVGHNLGLRHNFKGNLGASDEPEVGGNASRSVMDYLGRAHRHLAKVGAYDRMAIAYAYQGIEPKRSNWFCTDQDVVNPRNLAATPECQRYDLTNDPYAYWRTELRGSFAVYVKFMLAGNEAQKKIAASMFAMAVNGMLAYAATADQTAGTWASWQRSEDRPDSSAAIKKYIAKDITESVCQSTGDPDWPELKQTLRESVAKWQLPTAEFACPENIKATIEF